MISDDNIFKTLRFRLKHLTNFAVLLDGGGGSGSGSGGGEGYVVQWLSLAFSIVAIVLVAIIISIAAIKGAYDTKKKNDETNTRLRALSTAQHST